MLMKRSPSSTVYVRVGSSIGHGQEEGLLVPQLEVLVGKLLAIDGLATGALGSVSYSVVCRDQGTYVAAGEVTTLEHEVGDHAMELGAGIAKALLAGAERAEVLCGLGYDIVEKLEVDATLLLCGYILGLAQVGHAWNTRAGSCIDMSRG
jgi:hypothetical protein